MMVFCTWYWGQTFFKTTTCHMKLAVHLDSFLHISMVKLCCFRCNILWKKQWLHSATVDWSSAIGTRDRKAIIAWGGYDARLDRLLWRDGLTGIAGATYPGVQACVPAAQWEVRFLAGNRSENAVCEADWCGCIWWLSWGRMTMGKMFTEKPWPRKQFGSQCFAHKPEACAVFCAANAHMPTHWGHFGLWASLSWQKSWLRSLSRSATARLRWRQPSMAKKILPGPRTVFCKLIASLKLT